MQVGLVGAPNSGKSTFMKATTLKDVEIANYPFTTIDANKGIAYVTLDCPCNEIDKTCDPKNSKCVDGTRMVPIRLLDVAGLVPDAHKGKGLGNQFLDDLREADVLIHVLDISGRTNAKGEPAEDYDPYKNIEFLERELNEWFKDIFEREWKKITSEYGHGDIELEKQLLSRFSGLKASKEDITKTLNNLQLADKDPRNWTDKEIDKFCIKLREKVKPIIIAANKVDLLDDKEKLEEIREKTESKVIPCCAEAELALREADQNDVIDYVPGAKNFEIKVENLDENKKEGLEFIRDILNKYGSTGIQKCLNEAVFNTLDKIIVFPVEDSNKFTDGSGRVLPDAHILNKNATSQDLAYSIHSDIGDNFIGAIDCRKDRKIGAEKKLENKDIIKILTKK